MKLHQINKYKLMAWALPAITLLSTGCTKEFLEPEPLSFYEPSKTFSTQKGLESALASCDKAVRNFFVGDGAPIVSEYVYSDLAVCGTTDQPSATGVQIDLNTYLTPTATDNVSTTRYLYFWKEIYKNINYANTIITYIDDVEGLDEEVKNEKLGRAYFHRALRYYWLVFQFKDVPLFTQAVEGAKFDYQSTKRSVILDMITRDLEFAVQHVAEVPEMGGMVSKGACRHLLIKCLLATGRFDEAIAEANTLIDGSGYQLMTSTFGTFVNPMPDEHPVTRNVIWDLHRPENKMIGENKEVIHCMINRHGYSDSSDDMQTMRNCVPFWPATGSFAIMTPSGETGMSISATYFNYRKALGRGVAKMRPTNYAQYGLWLGDPTDLRHDAESGNWINMENLRYNHPNLFRDDDPYAGMNLQLYDEDGGLLCTDTIRSWFGWPHYKVWVEDPDRESGTDYRGGEGDWYLFRLAETYLLRAEAYIWKGDKASAAADVNAIRERAHCTKLFTPEEMNMGVVMDERARELYMEEWRHVELSRVSYIYALTGQTDEFGQTYSEETISDNSYWWQRVCKYNNFYNSGIKTRSNVAYTISPYHIFFPVPQSSINGNREGVINQNKGYAGYEHNVEPFDNLEEAIASELDFSN